MATGPSVPVSRPSASHQHRHTDTDMLGTYKPQMHAHYLPHLSLSYARHTNALNQTFILLSSDYSKSLHLQSDRFLEFHTPGGLHYSTRIPRYGRDLKYSKRNTEALIPAVGLGADGNGEVFRLNLELGRFMKGYDIDLGHDRINVDGLQGGVDAEAVNAAAVAEHSHNLLAFGTSLGTVEFWDDRSRSRVGTLDLPKDHLAMSSDARQEISVLEFKSSGLQIALGTSTGKINLFDLRSPAPLLKKEQGYDFPIQNITFLGSDTMPDKIMSADKRIIKLWDANTGDPWTSIEPAVDLNHVEYIPKTGMFLTANEGRQQHAFLIPQLGPAPKWCAFLDNLVEEMAEDAQDPASFGGADGNLNSAGAVYDNYKFLSVPQLRQLSLEHLIGQTTLLRPYMHGYFVAQKLYEQARLISNPDLFTQQREKTIQQRIAKERVSRVRGSKAVKVKVNRKLAEKLLEKEDANERRKARRVLRQGGDDPDTTSQAPTTDVNADLDVSDADHDTTAVPAAVTLKASKPERKTVLQDDRFTRLFEDADFEIDETSREFAMQNPSTQITTATGATSTASDARKRGLTAAEEEDLALASRSRHAASSDSDNDSSDSGSESEDAADIAARNLQRQGHAASTTSSDKTRISSGHYKKAGHVPKVLVSNTQQQHQQQQRQDRSRTAGAGRTKPSFGDMARALPARGGRASDRKGGVVGEKSVTFAPAPAQSGSSSRGARHTGGGGGDREVDDGGVGRNGRQTPRRQDRRSASGNVFRRM